MESSDNLMTIEKKLDITLMDKIIPVVDEVVGDTTHLILTSLDKVEGPFIEVDDIKWPFQESLGSKGILVSYYEVNGIRMSEAEYELYVKENGISREWYKVNWIRMSAAEYKKYKAKKIKNI